MKFVEVKEAPRMKHSRNELKARVDEFMAMRTKIVQVEWKDTYKSAAHAQAALCRCAKRWAYPIKTRRRGDAVYMIRCDM